MKTKNVILVASVIISGILNVSGVFARDVKSDQVTLNIKLNAIQTISVTANNTINLNYLTKDHYKKGVSSTSDDHLTVFSTGGFQVYVNSDGNLSNGLATPDIDASDVTILATHGTDNPLADSSKGAVALGTNQASIISSTEGGRELKYNVTYNNESGGSYKYINHYEDGGNNTFTTQVTYTIAAQ